MEFSPGAKVSRAVASGFGAGFGVACVTSAGLLGERVSEGSARVALLVNAVVTFAAVAYAWVSMRYPAQFCVSRLSLASRVLGALTGIFLVHATLHAWAPSAPPWLSEQPRQFVNDLAAAFSVLVLVATLSHARSTRALAGLLAGTALIAAYRMNAASWHLDRAPHGFGATVQQLVVAQFASVALALLVFQAVLSSRRSS